MESELEAFHLMFIAGGFAGVLSANGSPASFQRKWDPVLPSSTGKTLQFNVPVAHCFYEIVQGNLLFFMICNTLPRIVASLP
ncbi:MAG: hypothetical protein LBD10_05120 [Desulfobulbus sp.]|jgi:hypothetical protein|uniref:hypothetical protein n=1 Tax=Desulfobulbus sp. TaxID=895 RepID=UPI0028446070|nr:hypothetical protein [Desulfobulbus sp.]MDR2549566.1 hypothetical protein [Desulfobulbus sp.]